MQLILFVAAIVVFLLATFIPSVPRFNLIAFGLALGHGGGRLAAAGRQLMAW